MTTPAEELARTEALPHRVPPAGDALPPAPNDEPLPALDDRFRVSRIVGRGGMATVYAAYDLRHDREVAVKLMKPHVSAALGVGTFLREIKLTAQLQHPHILPLFDSGEMDGRPYYVMPFVAGGTLRARLMEGGCMPATDVVRIGGQVAAALDFAHRHGVVHRDIKPENILLDAGDQHAYVSDFGIAQAIARAEHDVAATTGLVFGTPAYMSPEHAGGARDLDGRSDVYSLARVVQEMLTGVHPTRRALLPLPGLDSAPAGFSEGALSPATEQVLHRALSFDPDARFSSASEFVRSLDAALVETGRRPATAVARDDGRRRRRQAITAVAATLLGSFVLASHGEGGAGESGGAVRLALDPELTAVLPFRDVQGSAAVLTGDNVGRLLYDALGYWHDLRLADEMRVYDERLQLGSAVFTTEQARAWARTLGAGRFVWGEVSVQNGAMRIHAQLYDTREGVRLASHVAYAEPGADVQSVLRGLGDSLVAKVVGTPAAAVGVSGTKSLAALKQYTDGYAALHVWDTEVARRHFQSALDLDADFAQASLGLAQSMAWSGVHAAPTWREPAARAVADSARLAPRDRLLAGALLALADGRMADACTTYRGLIARDPRDFAAHYGLGDCLSMDPLVVRDRTDPTQWVFRGSLHSAIAEYQTALSLIPSFLDGSRGQAFARLTNRILFTEDGRFRSGFALAPDTLRMAAFPELRADTLAFQAFPLTIDSIRRPTTNQMALQSNRLRLHEFAAQWVQAFPSNPRAHAQLSHVLEMMGILEGARGAPAFGGALGAIESARRLAPRNAADGIEYAAAQVRVLLKLRRFDGARSVVDSTLNSWPTPSAHEATLLAPLAALTGRAHLTARLLERAASDTANEIFVDEYGRRGNIPADLFAHASRFAGYAALGGPAESLLVLRARTERALGSSTSAAERRRLAARLLVASSIQAQPGLGPRVLLPFADPTSDFLAQWHALARGHMTEARRRVRGYESRVLNEGPPAPDISLVRAQLLLSVGDTIGAAAVLDEVITSLPTQQERLTTEIFPAAALPRIIVMRAAIARSGIRPEVVSWSDARSLWSHADPELRAAADSASGRRTTGS